MPVMPWGSALELVAVCSHVQLQLSMSLAGAELGASWPSYWQQRCCHVGCASVHQTSHLQQTG